MYDCCSFEPTADAAAPTAVELLPDAADYGLAVDPYADIVALLEAGPMTSTPASFDPMAPTLAEINGHLDAAALNMAGFNPGYSAGWDDSTGSVAWTADGDLTPSLPSY